MPANDDGPLKRDDMDELWDGSILEEEYDDNEDDNDNGIVQNEVEYMRGSLSRCSKADSIPLLLEGSFSPKASIDCTVSQSRR